MCDLYPGAPLHLDLGAADCPRCQVVRIYRRLNATQSLAIFHFPSQFYNLCFSFQLKPYFNPTPILYFSFQLQPYILVSNSNLDILVSKSNIFKSPNPKLIFLSSTETSHSFICQIAHIFTNFFYAKRPLHITGSVTCPFVA